MSQEASALGLGIRAVSVYYPDTIFRASDVAASSGLPEGVVTEKFGLRQKHVAGPDEHVSGMSVRAARALFADRNLAIRPDAPLVYFGSSIKDYELWSCAVAVQHQLAMSGGYAFEIASNCAGFGVALHVTRGLFAADPDMHQILLVGASKEASLVDYTDQATKSVFAFGDGAAALLVERATRPGLEILSTAVISDGTFNTAVMVPAGGTVMPASPSSLAADGHRVRIQPGVRLATEVGPQFIELMTRVGGTAIRRAGVTPPDVDVVLVQHQIPSVVGAVMDGLGCGGATTVDLSDYGHMSSLDIPTAIYLALSTGALESGATALLLSAGLGYTWSGAVIRVAGPVAMHGMGVS